VKEGDGDRHNVPFAGSEQVVYHEHQKRAESPDAGVYRCLQPGVVADVGGKEWMVRTEVKQTQAGHYTFLPEKKERTSVYTRCAQRPVLRPVLRQDREACRENGRLLRRL
jgi:hypothetical protein